jgi:hypothetical protein
VSGSSGTVVVTNHEGQKGPFLLVRVKAVASDQPETLSVQQCGDVSLLLLGSALFGLALQRPRLKRVEPSTRPAAVRMSGSRLSPNHSSPQRAASGTCT